MLLLQTCVSKPINNCEEVEMFKYNGRHKGAFVTHKNKNSKDNSE